MSFSKVLRTSTVQRQRTFAALSSLRSLHATQKGDTTDRSFQFVVCGGGTGGLAVGSSLARRFGPGKVAIIEPAEVSTLPSIKEPDKLLGEGGRKYLFMCTKSYQLLRDAITECKVAFER